MITTLRLRTVALAIGLSLCSSAVLAEGEDVLTRARPDYDALGISLGAFRLFPTFDLTATYDDNIYRTTDDAKSDWFFQYAPRASFRSQWSRHALNIFGGASFVDYSRFSGEDQTNWDVGLDARVDIVQGSFFNGTTSRTQTHEARFSPDSPGYIAEPIPF